MKPTNKKIGILFSGILLSVLILSVSASGSENINIELGVTQLSPFIGEETEFIVTVNNTGTINITNIKVIVDVNDKNICNETVALLTPSVKEKVSCKWIPDECDLEGGSTAISATAKTMDDSATKTRAVTVTGKAYNISIPENPTINQEIIININDEEGLAIDDAKIKINFKGNLIDDGTVKNGIFKFTPAEDGTYTIFVEKEMEGYCKVNKKELDIKNSFIVHGLKSQYGIDEELDIKITDANDDVVDLVTVIVSGPLSREFTTQEGILKFKLKDKGFEKGNYLIIFQEYKAKPGTPSRFWELTKNFVVADEPLPEPEEEPPVQEEEPEEVPVEEPEPEENISNVSAPEEPPEIKTTTVQEKTFLEKYWLWVLIFIGILIIIAILWISTKEKTPEKKEKPGGLRGL